VYISSIGVCRKSSASIVSLEQTQFVFGKVFQKKIMVYIYEKNAHLEKNFSRSFCVKFGKKAKESIKEQKETWGRKRNRTSILGKERSFQIL